jgi:hypothetical protein
VRLDHAALSILYKFLFTPIISWAASPATLIPPGTGHLFCNIAALLPCNIAAVIQCLQADDCLRGMIVLFLLVVRRLACELFAFWIGSAHRDGTGFAIGRHNNPTASRNLSIFLDRYS